MRLVSALCVVLALALLSPLAVLAQPAPPPPSGSVPRLINISGVFQPADGQPLAPVEVVTLSIYAAQEGDLPLWQEMQTVTPDKTGRFTVLLGATHPDGLPPEVFASGEARWMGLLFARPGEVERPRVRITSVPYALKASDAETLGGRPASAYLLAPTEGDTARRATGASAGDPPLATAQSTVTANLIQPGTTNFLAKYVNSADVGNSAVYGIGGKVGIGTTTPLDRLHVRFTNTNGTFAGLAVQNLGSTAASYSGMLFYDQNGGLGQFQGFNNVTHEYRINNIASNGSIHFLIGGSSIFKIASTGRVGIGPGIPTKAKLEINGVGGNYTITHCYVLNFAGPASCAPGTLNGLSLYSSNGVAAGHFVAFSDGRIKQVGRRSDAAHDLQTLARIEVTDYTYLDTVSKGAGPQKKVIGQQVEQVFPQAVRRGTDVVPDIYANARIRDGWVMLATTLKTGDRVRLIGTDTDGVQEVLDAAPDRFRTAFAGGSDHVFVYGREVTDFRMVDYEAIAMLNVSATQELHRRIEDQNRRLEEQASDLARLRQQLSALEALVRAAGRVESTRVADAEARPH